jgi:TPR repeat protein
MAYYKGEGLVQNRAEAAKWIRKAADQGMDIAQVSLAEMYASGQPFKQDFKEALKWYRKAAEQGHPTAQFNLALMYSKGQGVPANLTQALMWANLAVQSAKGSELMEAVELRDSISSRLATSKPR